MKILKNHELFNKVISVFCSAVVPAIINFLAMTYWNRNQGFRGLSIEAFAALSSILGAIFTITLLLIIYSLLPKFRRFREFGKYEGRWLQIIPEFDERPYSIIDFEYNKELRKYELKGINFFSELSEGGISFYAYRFVERTFRDGFYYITNQTTENKNGLGKLGFIKSNYDSLTRAEGYFFDSSNEKESRKYNTILVKCDKAFFEHIKPQFRFIKIKDIPPIEIMKLSKSFADNEIRNYNKKHGERVNQNTSCTQANKCEFCGCDKKSTRKHHIKRIKRS